MNNQNELSLEGVRIGYLNFEGRAQKFNKEGDRNITLFLTPEQEAKVSKAGYNVKQPKEDLDRDPENTFKKDPTLQLAMKFEGFQPAKVWVVSGSEPKLLSADTVSTLDTADIITSDVVIRPYDWEVNGDTGRKAYLKAIYVTLDRTPFDDKYGI